MTQRADAQQELKAQDVSANAICHLMLSFALPVIKSMAGGIAAVCMLITAHVTALAAHANSIGLVLATQQRACSGAHVRWDHSMYVLDLDCEMLRGSL